MKKGCIRYVTNNKEIWKLIRKDMERGHVWPRIDRSEAKQDEGIVK